jgi:ABC-type nitrate/sulfonate/bicarbonate transport system permease component
MARVSDIARQAPPDVGWLSDPAVLRRALWNGARLASPLLIIVAWEYLARSGAVTEYMLPPLSAVIARVIDDVTSTELGLGILMSRSHLAHWFFDPIVSVGFPMPKIAFLPVFILWFGLYDLSKITIIIVNAIFPVITATLVGLQGVEREIVWSARSLGASERRIGWEIVVPAALPQILTGLQVALPTSLIVALVSEFIMGGYGLGARMMESSRLLDSPGVFAGILEIAVVGQCVLMAMVWVRRRLLGWHQETLNPVTA